MVRGKRDETRARRNIYAVDITAACELLNESWRYCACRRCRPVSTATAGIMGSGGRVENIEISFVDSS